MKTYSLIVVSLLCVLLTGCQSGDTAQPKDLPPLFSCVITITQESAPLDGATVLLVPEDSSRDWYVAGLTNSSGVATMKASSRWDGAPKGKYKVVVSKFESDPSKVEPIADDADEATRQKYETALSNERLATYTVVEAQYGDAAKTPLEINVESKTAQTFDVGAKIRLKTR